MAIVKMDKLSIIGMKACRADMLDYLMKRGFVQIDDSTYLTEEEEYKGVLKRNTDDSLISELEQKMFLTEEAIGILAKISTVKKKMFDPKRKYSGGIDVESLYAKVLEVNETVKRKAALNTEENSVNTAKIQYAPWKKYDADIAVTETRSAKVFLGTFPANADLGAIRKAIEEKDLSGAVYKVDQDKMMQYIYGVSLKTDYEGLVETLRENRFQPVTFTDVKGTPLEILKNYDDELALIKNKMNEADLRLKELAESLNEFEDLYDYFSIEHNRKKEAEKLISTNNTFYLFGWAPESKAQKLKDEMLSKFECYVETEHGNKEEGFPILLENNKLVTPFESVTMMYSCPSSRDEDPNTVLAVFYAVFFGIMLGDLAYGLILMFACGFYVWKMKYKKGEGNLIKMLAICGFTTSIAGAAMSSFLGMAIPGITPVINPMEDVMQLLVFSFGCGVIHIFASLGIKGYSSIKQGKPLDALFDVVFWYIFVSGICMVVLPVIMPEFSYLSDMGLKITAVGAILLVLTQGRDKPGVFGKLFGGVSSLYGVINYFSDILSYSRIMALCLTTAVISQVVNILGNLIGSGPAIAVGIVGHTLNFLINALGTYVHTSRLHYVEFFSRFYEGGGTPFTPFKEKTKYTETES